MVSSYSCNLFVAPISVVSRKTTIIGVSTEKCRCLKKWMDHDKRKHDHKHSRIVASNSSNPTWLPFHLLLGPPDPDLMNLR